MEEKRPNPDVLLEQIKQSDIDSITISKKGNLKIFLGYSAGVGKTYKMLQEAALSKKNGTDIVIGIVETHKRKETEGLLVGLEIVPRKKINYSGITLEEMGLDAVLNRKPQLVLVDELAHTNAPGSRHTRRYQDVVELLNAGIDVFTTLNIQHIESLNDVVQQISGIKVGERVPDNILESALEIELVDLTPEKLIERFKEGKVYYPQKAEQAMNQFFKKSNLLALRELSLKYTAKQVDEDIQDFMKKNAIPGPWQVGSSILVAISASPTTERLLRFSYRMATDLDAQWYAVFVQSSQSAKISPKARIQLDKNIRLAEELGAKVILLSGNEMADEIINFAKSKNVNLIIIGPSRRTFAETVMKGSVINKIIKKSGSINTLIVSEGGSEKNHFEKYNPLLKKDYKAYISSFAIISLTVLIGWLLRTKIEPINIGMMLLLPSIASGVIWGIRVGLFASVISVCIFDYLFIPPYLTFAVANLKYLPSFAVFILVSTIISFLAKSIRQESENSKDRERFVYSLYSFSREIIAGQNLSDILNRAVNNIADAFEGDVVIFLPDEPGRLAVNSKSDDSIFLNENEQAVALWSYVNGKPAGRGTDTLSSSVWHYYPLKIKDKIFGVIGLKKKKSEDFLTSEQEQLFRSFASIVALAVTKSLIK